MDVFAFDGSNMTTLAPTPTPAPTPAYLGFIAAAVSVLFFGSNFVPIKKFETGDGLFFQWILCASIWFVGVVVNMIMGGKTFYMLAMLGGCLWAVGNTMVVPIIKTIGLGQGILIWAVFNMLMGWASGRFGWFGLNVEEPPNTTLNYIGISLCVLSAIMYVFIKSEAQVRVDGPPPPPPDTDPAPAPTDSDDTESLLPKVHVQTVSSRVSIVDSDESYLERMSLFKRRTMGCCMAVVSGLLYGSAFNPIIYIMDHNKTGQAYDGASSRGLDYVFAHFTGIFATSTIIFTVYCIASRNAPRVYPRAILPGMASGVMWAVADAAWFVANDALSEAISFPIITTGPAIVAALWGVVLFREIRGRVNLLILLIAFSLGISGTVITGVSKIEHHSTNTTLTGL